MREEMERLGLEPDAKGECRVDTGAKSGDAAVVKCGEYLEGLRAEVGKLAGGLRERRGNLRRYAGLAVGAVAIGMSGFTFAALRGRKRAKIVGKM